MRTGECTRVIGDTSKGVRAPDPYPTDAAFLRSVCFSVAETAAKELIERELQSNALLMGAHLTRGITRFIGQLPGSGLIPSELSLLVLRMRLLHRAACCVRNGWFDEHEWISRAREFTESASRPASMCESDFRFSTGVVAVDFYDACQQAAPGDVDTDGLWLVWFWHQGQILKRAFQIQ